MALLDERPLQLAEVFDDPVQDDGQLAVLAAGQRVRVLLAHAAVGGPARMAEPGVRDGAVRLGGLLQLLEIADGANVVESVTLEEGEARRVVAAVLQALESLDEERLARSRPDVSDDSAHPELLPQRLFR